MNARATIDGFISAAREAEDVIEDLDYQIKTLKRELTRLESLKIGELRAKRASYDSLRQAMSSLVTDEITFREVEIAAMKGLTLVVGEPLTNAIRNRIRNTPALPFFHSID